MLHITFNKRRHLLCGHHRYSSPLSARISTLAQKSALSPLAGNSEARADGTYGSDASSPRNWLRRYQPPSITYNNPSLIFVNVYALWQLFPVFANIGKLGNKSQFCRNPDSITRLSLEQKQNSLEKCASLAETRLKNVNALRIFVRISTKMKKLRKSVEISRSIFFNFGGRIQQPGNSRSE